MATIATTTTLWTPGVSTTTTLATITLSVILAVCLIPTTSAVSSDDTSATQHQQFSNDRNHIFLISGTVDVARQRSRVLHKLNTMALSDDDRDSEGANDPNHFILHFTNDVGLPDSSGQSVSQRLAQYFHQRPHFIPNNAYIVYCTPKELAQFMADNTVSSSTPVEWADTLMPFQKYHPNLIQELEDLSFRGLNCTPSEMPSILLRIGIAETVSKITILKKWKALVAIWNPAVALGEPPASSSTMFVVATVPQNDAAQMVRFFAEQPEVYFIDQQKPMKFHLDSESIVVQGHTCGGTCDLSVRSTVPTPTGTTDTYRPIWKAGIYGKDEIVTVSDSGLDYYNCYFSDSKAGTPTMVDLKSVSVTSGNANHRKVLAYIPFDPVNYHDVYDSSVLAKLAKDSTDTKVVTNCAACGHGTHVSHCAVGMLECATPTDPGNNAKTCLPQAGVAPLAKLVFEDIMDSTGYLLGSIIKLLAGAAQTLGSKIHSNSWGNARAASTDAIVTYDYNCFDVDDFMWQNPEQLILFSVGNSGQLGEKTIGSPGLAKNALSVGAANYDQASIAKFSSFGPTADGRIKPDVVGPGVSVYAASSQGNNPSASSQCQYTTKSGTSQATPVVAGTAALLREALRKGSWFDGTTQSDKLVLNPPAGLLKALLMTSADTIITLASSDSAGIAQTNVPTTRQGVGRVNLANIMFLGTGTNSNGRKLWFTTDKSFSSAPMIHTYCFQIAATTPAQKTRILLYWPDEAASVESSKNLVNDLNLMIFKDGFALQGNYHIASTFSSTFDNTNNFEVIEAVLPAGNYIIQVGMDRIVDVANQPYFLTVLGPINGPDEAYCTPTCINTQFCTYDPLTAKFTSCPTSQTCHGAGQCVNHQCQCNSALYSGLNCLTTASCPASLSACNNRGCKLGTSTQCTCMADALNGFYSSSTSCSGCATGYGPDSQNSNKCLFSTTCSNNGVYDTNSQSCVCYDNATMGHFGGRSCGQCISAIYDWPLCKCAKNGDTVCGGHGTCTASGCVCFNDAQNGYWGGAACDVCADGFFGATASVLPCTYVKNCTGHGTYTTGASACVCNVGGWSGTVCDVCGTGWTGSACLCTVTNGKTCAGHGFCATGPCTCEATDGNGYWMTAANSQSQCTVCQPGYSPSPDSTLTKGCRCSNTSCSGHGTCGYDGCTCYDSDSQGHWQVGTNGLTCNSCKTGWTGNKCNCYVDPTTDVCNGRGICTDSGCVCNSTLATGFWASSSSLVNIDCAACGTRVLTSDNVLVTFGGVTKNQAPCMNPFRTSLTGSMLECFGRGTWNATAKRCACADDNDRGHWMYQSSDSLICDKCRAGWSGKNCKCWSDSTTGQECGPHGDCTDNGCVCHSNATHGYWDLTQVNNVTSCQCKSGYSNAANCKCFANCGGSDRGNCTDFGCMCMNDTTFGFFTSDVVYGWYPQFNATLSRNCDLCQAGYSGNNPTTKCLCSNSNCQAVEATGGGVNGSNTTLVNLTSGTVVYLTIPSTGIVKPSSSTGNLSLLVKTVSTADAKNPDRSTQAPMIYLGSTFKLAIDTSSAAASTLGVSHVSVQSANHWSSPSSHHTRTMHSEATIWSNKTENGTLTTIKLDAPLTIRVPFLGQAIAQSKANVDWKVDYKINPPTLMMMSDLPNAVWQRAYNSCTPEFNAPAPYFTSDFFLVTSVCQLYIPTTYFAVVVSSIQPVPGGKEWPTWWFGVGGALIGVLLVIVGAVIFVCVRRVRREKRDRKLKEQVILYLTTGQGLGKSMRLKLGLSMRQDFTVELAARRFASRIEETQELVAKVASMKAERTKTVFVVAGDRLDEWTFLDHEIEVLDAVQKVRGLFPQGSDPFSKQGIINPRGLAGLDQIYQKLQAEVEKLRKYQGAVKKPPGR